MCERNIKIICGILEEVSLCKDMAAEEDFITRNLDEINANEKFIEENFACMSKLQEVIKGYKKQHDSNYKSLLMLECFLNLPEIAMYSKEGDHGKVSSISEMLAVMVREVEIELDIKPGSWYKECVENNISTSNSQSTEKEETIMPGEKAKVEETTEEAGATFGQKFKAVIGEVKGPTGWLLLGMAILGGVQMGTKAFKDHKAKQAEHSVS